MIAVLCPVCNGAGEVGEAIKGEYNDKPNDTGTGNPSKHSWAKGD